MPEKKEISEKEVIEIKDTDMLSVYIPGDGRDYDPLPVSDGYHQEITVPIGEQVEVPRWAFRIIKNMLDSDNAYRKHVNALVKEFEAASRR